MLEILTTNNPTLLKKAEEVEKIDKKVLEIIEEMKVALINTYDPVGVGLAAPQVGVSLRIFLAKPTKKSKIMVFINPRFVEKEEVNNQQESVSKSAKTNKSHKRLLEGCLSLPDIWGKVVREREITLEYQDEKGIKHTKTFKGFMSTIVQHEMDHLEGVLFTKRSLEQNQTLYRSYKTPEGEDEFEEIKI